ncbi:beta-mannosidase [Butyrivibrio sp. MC2013]|uniref:beta-mannosidase n=1 Tax=Butyrivibrio sp. MC2013 TaxID=1280686 RepID=UPI0003FA6D3D|nr:sugar-binding domain-containing protein [Butyrivibrio sp. MC2013]
MLKQKICDNWTLRIMGEQGGKKAINAKIPGSIYTDLLRAGEMEDPFWKDNEDAALALMDNDYLYECSFVADKQLLDKPLQILRFEGLDTIAEIALNGRKLGQTKNMHRAYEFDVTGAVRGGENHLSVTIFSPTRYIREQQEKDPIGGSEDAMPGFPHIRKAHCSFGWDWGAHLPDGGIYRPIYLIGAEKARIESVKIRQDHKKLSSQNEIRLYIKPEILLKCESLGDYDEKIKELAFKLEIYDPEGKKIIDHKENTLFRKVDNILSSMNRADGLVGLRLSDKKEIGPLKIDFPRLWWPNGYGRQPLYTVKMSLYSGSDLIDSTEEKIGLRTIDLSCKKGQKAKDFAIRVNGTPIFAMGADYIPEDHLLGRVNENTTRRLLEKAVFANYNCIRVWGGGYYPDDYFFDICDELGLVVWQDMMFACAVYHLDSEFEANIREEFTQNIKRLRNHASLGLFCGNNEMEQFVKGRLWVHDESEVRDYTIMYEKILPDMVKELAENVAYWPSSPSSGGAFDEPSSETRGDQHYWDVWHGNKPFTEFRKFKFRFLSEFGFQSFPMRKTVDLITDDPADRNIFSYVFERHQRNGQANGKIMNYMQQTYRYPTDFDTILYASHMLQADAIRYGIEHFRRYRGECMGAVVWQLNDCWPVSSWSSIDYSGRLKALHYSEKRAFAPLMISCEEEGRINSSYALNEYPGSFNKSIRLCISNETMQDRVVRASWKLMRTDGEEDTAYISAHPEAKGTKEIVVPALSSVWMDKIQMQDVDEFENYVSYELEDEDGVIVSSGSVIFSLPKYYKYRDPQLKAYLDNDEIIVESAAYARGIEIQNENEDLILSDNYFDMDKGQRRIKILSGNTDSIRLRSVFDIK